MSGKIVSLDERRPKRVSLYDRAAANPDPDLRLLGMAEAATIEQERLDDLLRETKRYPNNSPATWFARATYYILNGNDAAPSAIERIIECREDNFYITRCMALFQFVERSEMSRHCLERLIGEFLEHGPYDSTSVEIATYWARTQLGIPEERFREEIAFGMQRKRFR